MRAYPIGSVLAPAPSQGMDKRWRSVLGSKQHKVHKLQGFQRRGSFFDPFHFSCVFYVFQQFCAPLTTVETLDKFQRFHRKKGSFFDLLFFFRTG